MIKRKAATLSVVTLLAIVLIAAYQPSYAKSPKHLATARRISTWGTLGPLAIGGAAILARPHGVAVYGGIALGSMGLLWGPSMGHAYAGNTSRFFTGSGLRILAIGGIVGGVAMFAIGVFSENDKKKLTLPGIVLSVGSTGFLVFTIIKDFNTLDDSIDAYNRKHGFTSLDLRPEYFPSQEALGLALSFRF